MSYRRLAPSNLKHPRRIRTVVALALGFATVPAVALGVTNAASPGDPFKLGETNEITNATTIIKGTGQTSAGVLQVKRASGRGAALTVANESAPNGIARTGISIRVPAATAPISVNEDASTASNLSADKLDGRDQTEFMSASRVYRVGTTPVRGNGNGSLAVVTATDGLKCDTGDIAIGGGGNAIDADDDLNAVIPFSGSYQLKFQDNGAPGTFAGFIVCSDAALPFK
jgi:hypothetical protein